MACEVSHDHVVFVVDVFVVVVVIFIVVVIVSVIVFFCLEVAMGTRTTFTSRWVAK